MTKINLPEMLPIFPLHGVLLLPGGRLPLNIFEPRYLDMCDKALRTDRMIGVIQPLNCSCQEVYTTGCAGKIMEFTETSDGRYEITLQGISRFTIAEEIEDANEFRSIRADWGDYLDDSANEKKCLGLKRDRLKQLLQGYFKREGMECSWKAIDDSPDGRLMTCLAMTCPLPAAEKQALLEEKCCKKRASMFMTILEMELHKYTEGNT